MDNHDNANEAMLQLKQYCLLNNKPIFVKHGCSFHSLDYAPLSYDKWLENEKLMGNCSDRLEYYTRKAWNDAIGLGIEQFVGLVELLEESAGYVADVTEPDGSPDAEATGLLRRITAALAKARANNHTATT